MNHTIGKQRALSLDICLKITNVPFPDH